MAGEFIATGIVISIGDGAVSELFTAIPGIVGVPNFPAPKSATVDVTALDSTALEYLVTLPDNGIVSMTLNLRKKSSGTGYIAAQQTLEGYAADGVQRGLKIEVKHNGTLMRTYTCQGFVLSFVPQGGAYNSQLQAVVEFQVSGAVTRA